MFPFHHSLAQRHSASRTEPIRVIRGRARRARPRHLPVPGGAIRDGGPSFGTRPTTAGRRGRRKTADAEGRRNCNGNKRGTALSPRRDDARRTDSSTRLRVFAFFAVMPFPPTVGAPGAGRAPRWLFRDREWQHDPEMNPQRKSRCRSASFCVPFRLRPLRPGVVEERPDRRAGPSTKPAGFLATLGMTATRPTPHAEPAPGRCARHGAPG